MVRATAVTPIDACRLRIEYEDGSIAELSLEGELEGPLFGELADAGTFARVHVDELGAVEWENGASLAPEFVSELPRLTPQRP